MNNQKYIGYNEETLPKIRTMGLFNYFTLWVGSIHNIPNYAAVGAFLFIGLKPIHIISAILIASVVLSLFMVLNGEVGSKYGIPFTMHLRSTYGDLGAKLSGFLRGVVAVIAWFGLQNFTGSLALLVTISKLWPGFLEIGSGIDILGISVPGLIFFTIFWFINVLIGLGWGKILNKFTAILNPLIYIVFIGMTAWTLAQVDLGVIMNYQMGPQTSTIYGYFLIINSVFAVWAAPGASVSDFTQYAKSRKDAALGQTLSFTVGYLIFAFCSVIILIGESIIYGVNEWKIVSLITKWDSIPLVLMAMGVLLMTTISTNATGNIMPAGFQLSALFPKHLNYKKGVIIAGIISYVMLPWKFMQHSDSIFVFLNIIGATLGPVAGVMLVHYYFVAKQTIVLEELFFDPKSDKPTRYRGINKKAYVATVFGFLVAVSGSLIPKLVFLTDLSWIISLASSGLLYYIMMRKYKHYDI